MWKRMTNMMRPYEGTTYNEDATAVSQLEP